MIEVIFLLVLGLIWVTFATISDVKSTFIFDWLNISLIIFALGFRFFYSLFTAGNFAFFYQGLIGLGIFFVVGNLFYYSRLFAGGDAKLMIALGAILPLSSNFATNIKIELTFLFLFLVAGGIYGIFSTTFISIKNFKNFKKELRSMRKKFLRLAVPVCSISIIFMVLGLLLDILVFYLGILLFLMPLLYIYAKAVDEACMVKEKKPENLLEGDWLYKDVHVGKKIIKANWNGLSKEDISFLRKSKINVVIRRGVAYTPVFALGFIGFILLYFIFNNFLSVLWNSFW